MNTFAQGPVIGYLSRNYKVPYSPNRGPLRRDSRTGHRHILRGVSDPRAKQYLDGTLNSYNILICGLL